MRYNRLTDIGLTEKQIEDNFLFDKGAKIGDTMTTALNAKDAKEWFGGMPPDLTLVARVRGTDWLYSYMRGFYRDDKATSGWNNRVFPGVSMPHVLHALQGTQRPVYEKRTVDGQEQTELVRLELTTPGALTSPEYDKLTHDLVNFLAYMGEPARAYRANIGIIVLIFLGGLFLVALWLKSEYWKDVK
jgi:ubiquinol-cytochrome c reductase cytochrome c1 subunit